MNMHEIVYICASGPYFGFLGRLDVESEAPAPIDRIIPKLTARGQACVLADPAGTASIRRTSMASRLSNLRRRHWTATDNGETSQVERAPDTRISASNGLP